MLQKARKVQVWQESIAIQLELFQSTKKLNLSETYEAIPKDVSPNDPLIKWINDGVAESVERPFHIDWKSFIAEISPANFKNKKTKKFQSHFPHLREARIEYAIISMASKQVMKIDSDSENNQIFYLKTTYYQIQKELVNSINKVEHKNLKPNDCPYNTSSIREALEILKRTDIAVRNESGENVYIFNRIKDIYMEDKKVVIELGNMITNYIRSWDWRASDSASILASKSYYIIKLRALLNLKFRYASKGATYNPSLSYLVDKINFHEHKEKRITLQKVSKLLESMPEISDVVIEKKFDGRKIVDAILHIHPSQDFINTMIENNQLTKRTEKAFLVDDTLMIEPLASESDSNGDYIRKKTAYDIARGKMLYWQKKKLFN